MFVQSLDSVSGGVNQCLKWARTPRCCRQVCVIEFVTENCFRVGCRASCWAIVVIVLWCKRCCRRTAMEGWERGSRLIRRRRIMNRIKEICWRGRRVWGAMGCEWWARGRRNRSTRQWLEVAIWRALPQSWWEGSHYQIASQTKDGMEDCKMQRV